MLDDDGARPGAAPRQSSAATVVLPLPVPAGDPDDERSHRLDRHALPGPGQSAACIRGGLREEFCFAARNFRRRSRLQEPHGGRLAAAQRGRALEVTEPVHRARHRARPCSRTRTTWPPRFVPRADALPGLGATPIKERVVAAPALPRSAGASRCRSRRTRSRSSRARRRPRRSPASSAGWRSSTTRRACRTSTTARRLEVSRGVTCEAPPRAARRRRGHHAVQLPGDGADVDVPDRAHARATRSSSSRRRRCRSRRVAWAS